MQVSEAFEFTHEDRRSIYEHVEEADDPVSASEVREALRMEPRGFGHHVAILKRDGLLVERGGELRVAFEGSDEADEETFEDGDVEFTIRPAIETDRTGLTGVIRQVAGGKTYIVADSVAEVIDHEGSILQPSAPGSRMVFVATVNDEVVGWVHLDAPELEKLHHTAELTVGVLEEYHDHGIGTELLERGLDWADGHGYEKLYSSVPSSNEGAIGFLDSQGWETEAVRENHYKVDGEYLDEVMMAVWL